MINNIKEWYTSTFITDELGEEINPEASFDQLEDNLGNVYDYLGVHDSVVRERVFWEWCGIYKLPYAHIYDKWLNAAMTSV